MWGGTIGPMETMAVRETGLRARARRAIQTELVDVAMDLFLRDGFEETTVADIVEAAGISRRSFFRYFGSKEEVVLSHVDELGEDVAAQLQVRPREEDAWTALRHAVAVPLLQADMDPSRALAMMRMLEGTVTLKARYLERQVQWQNRLIPHVAARLGPMPGGGRAPDVRPAALVGSALACLGAARDAWMASHGTLSLTGLLDEAVRAVRPGAF